MPDSTPRGFRSDNREGGHDEEPDQAPQRELHDGDAEQCGEASMSDERFVPVDGHTRTDLLVEFLRDGVGFDRIPGGWFFYIGPFNVGWECRVRRA